VVLAQIQKFLSLGNFANKNCILLPSQPDLCFIKEGQSLLETLELFGNIHCDESVFERIKLICEVFNQHIIQFYKIGSFVKLCLLSVNEHCISQLMPQL